MNQISKRRITHLTTAAALFILSACASYQPRLGMTYDQWRSHWLSSNNWGSPKLVAAQGGMEAWTLGDGVYLYFQDGRLSKLDQGQLYKQRMEIEIIKK